MISIHAPRAGRDNSDVVLSYQRQLFQSTRPVRGATGEATEGLLAAVRISIHAPRAGRDPFGVRNRCRCGYFNPRAPCGARPRRAELLAAFRRNFNPRAPCGARPAEQKTTQPPEMTFQSTRPVRGATGLHATGQAWVEFQSTRPVRGATQLAALLKFQSTRPVRGATGPALEDRDAGEISIHAPRAGRDWLSFGG